MHLSIRIRGCIHAIETTPEHIVDAKIALRKGGVKLPTPWRIEVEMPKVKAKAVAKPAPA